MVKNRWPTPGSTIPVILPGAVLVLVAAISYLPLAHQLGFYNDDWYLLYAGQVRGAAGMMDIFAIDRPARGVLVGWLFDVFGTNAWLYSLSAFCLRAAGALGVWWLLSRVWPQQPVPAYLAALLFVVYPGFLDQPNAVDYQSHQVAFALEIFSLVLMVKAVDAHAVWLRWVFIFLASLSALLGFMLMEYYVGLLGLMFLVLYAVSGDGHPGWPARLRHSLAYFSLPFMAGLGFFLWRVAFFSNERDATNITLMAENLAGSPILRGLWMGIRLLQDVLNVLLIAWAEPLYRLVFTLRLKNILLAGGMGFAAACLVWLLFFITGRLRVEPLEYKATSAQAQISPVRMMALGLLAVILALIPINFGSRNVSFQDFGRFTLTASLGAAFVSAGLLALISPRWRVWLASLLVALAVMVHTANAIRYTENWNLVRNFWWQVSWRIPQIQPGTLLIASYANQGIAEDYFVWGPANLIYYPGLAPQTPFVLPLTAATLDQSDMLNTLRGAWSRRDRRGIISERDYTQALVLSKPSVYACVHVLDGTSPELSAQDLPEILVLAKSSKINRILGEAEPSTPPEAIFGQPPAADWCYYYEKASLARQLGNWEEVSSLGDEALAQDFRPYDWIEWLPFAQGYAYTGQYPKMQDIAAILRTDLFYRQEACLLARMDANGYGMKHPEGHQMLVDVLCQP